MSKENVDRFYAKLEEDRELRKKALALQSIYESQEEVIDAFLAMAADAGFPFSQEEFITVLYERAEKQPDP